MFDNSRLVNLLFLKKVIVLNNEFIGKNEYLKIECGQSIWMKSGYSIHIHKQTSLSIIFGYKKEYFFQSIISIV